MLLTSKLDSAQNSGSYISLKQHRLYLRILTSECTLTSQTKLKLSTILQFSEKRLSLATPVSFISQQTATNISAKSNEIT